MGLFYCSALFCGGETYAREETGTERCPYSHTDPKTVLRGHDGKEEFGRLVVEDGCCRYVSNRLWASLSDQVCSAAVLILIYRELLLMDLDCGIARYSGTIVSLC